MATSAPAPAPTPGIIAWTATADDQSAQFYVWVSAAIFTPIDLETLRAATLSADLAELRQQAIALQRLLPSHLSTWALTDLPSHELVARLRAESDEARSERDNHMSGKGRLQ